MENQEKLSLPKNSAKKIWLFVLAGALLFGGGYYFSDYRMLRNNPELAAKKESQKIISRISKLIELPAEEPTFATVEDTEKLKSQDFFQKAENGDKVLIYTQAKKAILYRPKTQKIIEFSSLLINYTPSQ